jgi:flagellar biosynthesis protein FlhA
MAEKENPFRWTAIALPLTILASILLIYLPLPAVALDWFLSANLAISLLILLTAVFVRSPLEFSIFPSILLVATMARMALNVATTRLILARGPIDGELAAGQVVRAFGEFVAADQLAVGLVIFLILFMVQFLVVTKGTTRIGEVAARFALDGLPGRQQAIDADLSAGVISHADAQAQRRRLLDGADFYGSMDGASKYIRGEALAGAVIIAINLVAGILFGLSHGMGFEKAIGTFSVLTIGDGLASQLPALLTSLAAGLLVTRGSTSINFSDQTWQQLMGRPAPLFLAAGLLVVFAFANMPVLPLSLLAACAIGIGWWLSRTQPAELSHNTSQTPADRRQNDAQSIERMLESSPLTIELGSDLLALPDRGNNDGLLARIGTLRVQLASSLGIIVPKVRIRDNLGLDPAECRILVHDQPAIRVRVQAGCCLRIGRNGSAGEPDPASSRSNRSGVELRTPGERHVKPSGVQATMPWAGSCAWIRRDQVAGERTGELLEPVEVIVRSLEWTIRANAAELLDRDAVRQLLDETARQHPVIVGEVLAARPGLQTLQGVLQTLVREQVSLRPLHRLLELILAGWADGLEQGPLVEYLRTQLGSSCSHVVGDASGIVHCFGLSPELEQWLAGREATRATLAGKTDHVAASLLRSVETGIRHMQAAGWTPVVVVRQAVRPRLAALVKQFFPVLRVIGDEELEGVREVDVIARIRMGEVQEPLAA